MDPLTTDLRNMNSLAKVCIPGTCSFNSCGVSKIGINLHLRSGLLQESCFI